MDVDIQQSVLVAIQKAGRSAFFSTNEYITKRILPEQYDSYADLSAASFTEIFTNLDDRVSKKQARSAIAKLVESEQLVSNKVGRFNFYRLANMDYLKNKG